MTTIDIKDVSGKKAGSADLAPSVFGIEPNVHVMHHVVRAQRASWRQGTHDTKTRGQVRGGGKKPWRQKGTGRARAGSNRSPVWRGGAILFGPQPRKYDFKVNKKIRKLALRMALSSRLAGDNLLVVKGFDLPEAKTKVFAKIAGNLGLSKALIIAPEESRNLVLSSRNLPGITLTTPDQLSVYEILKHKQLVLLEGAVEPVETRLK